MADHDLSGFARSAFTHDGLTLEVLRAGTGPAVVVMSEIPGISPKVLGFAERVVELGCTAVVPVLFGVPGKDWDPRLRGWPRTLAYTAATLGKLCVSREFTLLATGRTSRIVDWLRALAAEEHERCGGPGVGAVGMCLTGGFALAMAADERLVAPVLSQPALPLAATRKQAGTIDISVDDLAVVRGRCARGELDVLGLRFKGDRYVPAERFEFLRRELGPAFTAVELEDADAAPEALLAPHSVLTEHLIDAPGEPTRAALDTVLDLFRTRLLGERPGSSNRHRAMHIQAVHSQAVHTQAVHSQEETVAGSRDAGASEPDEGMNPAGTARFFVPTPSGAVAVRITGRPVTSAPAVLLLHANPGDSRDYDALLPSLEETHTVVAVDWPGYGGSRATAPEDTTAQDLVTVAERVLDALASHGIRRVVAVGNSVGGHVAIRLALGRPAAVAGLVLVSPAGFTRHNALTRAFCRHVMGRKAVARWLVRPVNRALLGRLRTESARATYARARRLRDDPDRLAVHCALWRSFASPDFDLRHLCKDLAVPTLLIWGRRDPVLPAYTDGRNARRAMPRAETVTLPTAHEPYNEDPGRLLTHVAPFLKRLSGGDEVPGRGLAGPAAPPGPTGPRS